MAESNGQEKTEKPTGKRRRDARHKGNVFQSQDVTTVVMLFGTFWVMRKFLPYIYTQLRNFMIHILERVASPEPLGASPQLGVYAAEILLTCSLPLLLLSIFLAVIASGVQTRFIMAFHSLRPDLGKLNPLNGLRKMFALRNLLELVKNLFKIAILLALLWQILRGDLLNMSRMISMQPASSAALMLSMIYDLVEKVCLAFAVVAFFDFLYQRWEYEKNLKMTKEEVKEEFKQTEGNPQIKGRIRSVQKQMAMSRMMQKVPQADVIIRNPTHFAVALRYDPKKDGAPSVIAKGQDEVALRIVRIGEENGVFIVEDKPLARALYAACELDQEIPGEFYGAVAEILVYLYKTGRRPDLFQ